MRTHTIAALWTMVAAAGCMGAADPMPTPQRPDGGKVLVSSSAALREGGPVETVGVIGLAGATAGAGEVELLQPATGTSTTVKASADGAFAAVLAAAAGDRILVTFRLVPEGPESEPIEIAIVRYDAAQAPATPSAGGVETAAQDGNLRAAAPTAAAAPDQGGRSRVTGSNLTPGERAAMGNVRTGQVVEASVAADGTLDVLVPAASNDTIVVIFRNPQNGLTGRMVSLSVPNP